MSGRASSHAVDLLADPGLILPGVPLLEFGGWQLGTQAVTPWRQDWRNAAGRAVGMACELPVQTWPQAAVRISRGRAATQADLAEAWARVSPGGRIAIVGANDLGAATWVRRLREWCGADPIATVARAHHRAAAFVRSAAAGPPMPAVQQVPADAGPEAPLLTVPPGVFSGDGLDGGTAAMLAHLATRQPARRILDLGCGAGHLGLWCARNWPTEMVILADADARAVAGAEANALALGSQVRCVWWDHHDPTPATDCDLVLVNPPAHAGSQIDLAAAQGLFRRGAESLTPGGRMLVVANRRLPYEPDLVCLGTVSQVADADGFKVLELVR